MILDPHTGVANGVRGSAMARDRKLESVKWGSEISDVGIADGDRGSRIGGRGSRIGDRGSRGIGSWKHPKYFKTVSRSCTLFV